jgi:ParB family transcriptional regulator, chromosome partitioning protein
MKHNQSLINPTVSGIIERVLISKLHYSKFALRNGNSSIEELKISIEEKGLLHPIIVRIDTNQYNDDLRSYEVVAGNRRFAACKQLGWKRITCHILELDDQDAFEVSLVENLHHKTLNPVEEAIACKKYIEWHGWGSVSELARKINKSHSFVSNRIRLLELPQTVLDKIVCRQTNPSVGTEILAFDNLKVRNDFINEVLDNKLTRKEIREIIRGHNHNKNNKYNKQAKEEDTNSDFLTNSYAVSEREKTLHEKERAISRIITSLRIALLRVDDSIDEIEKENWILWENLMHYRRALHKHIDDLLILKKKVKLYAMRGGGQF